MTRRQFSVFVLTAALLTGLAMVHVARIANTAAQGYLQVIAPAECMPATTPTPVLPQGVDL